MHTFYSVAIKCSMQQIYFADIPPHSRIPREMLLEGTEENGSATNPEGQTSTHLLLCRYLLPLHFKQTDVSASWHNSQPSSSQA